MRDMYRSIVVLEESITIREECTDHWMNMISQNVQVILTVDPTMQGNDGTERIPRYSCPNHRWSTSVLHWVKKAVMIVSFPSWAASLWKTELVGEHHLLPLVCIPALVISIPLQPLLNVDSGKQRFPDGGSSMICGFTDLKSNSFGKTGLFRSWLNSAVTLTAVVRNFLPTVRSAVLVTEAPAIRAPTIRFFSNSVRSSILTLILMKSKKIITNIQWSR